MIIGVVSQPRDRMNVSATVAHGLVKLGTAGLRRIGQLMCGMRGHEMLVHREPRKLSLKCTWCGYQSTGWEIGSRPRPDKSSVVRALKPDARLTPSGFRRAA